MSHNDEVFGNWPHHMTLVDWLLQHYSERENKAEEDCYIYFSNLKRAVVHLQTNVEQIFMQGWTAQLDSQSSRPGTGSRAHIAKKSYHHFQIKYNIYTANEISNDSLMTHDVINLRWIKMLSEPKNSHAKSTKSGSIYINICIGKVRTSWTDFYISVHAEVFLRAFRFIM